MSTVTIRQAPFLRRLRAALLLDLEPELVLVERMAVLRAAGWKPSEIARVLELAPSARRTAELRLKAAADVCVRSGLCSPDEAR